LIAKSQHVSPIREKIDLASYLTETTNSHQRVFDPDNRPKADLSSVSMTHIQD